MLNILVATFNGVLRDKVFHGILGIGCLFLLIPSASSFSLRQVTELAITLSLSLSSLLLLLLAVFLGGTSLWKDVDRRYTTTILGSTPVSRTKYLFGKYCGISLFVFLTAFLLSFLSLTAVCCTATLYPPERALFWEGIIGAILFDAIKYCLLIAVAFLLSTVSTSFFLPIFGTIATFLAGNATQEVYDYLQTDSSVNLPAGVKTAALGFYYLLPNFTIFDLKANAIYSLPIAPDGLVLTFAYALVYIAILLTGASFLFAHRELQ